MPSLSPLSSLAVDQFLTLYCVLSIPPYKYIKNKRKPILNRKPISVQNKCKQERIKETEKASSIHTLFHR